MGITSVFQTDEEVSSTSFRSSFLKKLIYGSMVKGKSQLSSKELFQVRILVGPPVYYKFVYKYLKIFNMFGWPRG